MQRKDNFTSLYLVCLCSDFGTASAMTDETPPNTETNTEPSSKKRKGPGRPRMKQRRPSLSSCSAEPQNQQAGDLSEYINKTDLFLFII